ncbi:MAG: hypothetical protein ILO34_06920, partial [Kiritimatiellae bacterium]|nr:hypothetical protein [Kiritimatiellia bacterium]
MKRVLVAVIVAAVGMAANAWTVRPGLQMARTGDPDGDPARVWINHELTYDGRDVYEASLIPLELVPGAVMCDTATSWTNPWSGNTHTWTDATLVSYRGQIYLENVQYGFGQFIDDGARIMIEETDLVANFGCGGGMETYTPPAAGWYYIDIRIFDNAGSKGPMWQWSG